MWSEKYVKRLYFNHGHALRGIFISMFPSLWIFIGKWNFIDSQQPCQIVLSKPRFGQLIISFFLSSLFSFCFLVIQINSKLFNSLLLFFPSPNKLLHERAREASCGFKEYPTIVMPVGIIYVLDNSYKVLLFFQFNLSSMQSYILLCCAFLCLF